MCIATLNQIKEELRDKMNKKLNVILTTVFFVVVSAVSVLCQTSTVPESKTNAPLQTSSSPQAQKTTFPIDLLEYFKGDWSGVGRFIKSGKEVASDFSFAPDLENRSLVVHEKERAQHISLYCSLEF